MISIKRITISELPSIVHHPDYANWGVIPISRHRANSYINNPRSSPADVVLYIAYINNEIVGYRTVMPDNIIVGKRTIKVGWLSGNWVNPAVRRHGIASKLFDEAFTDWEGRLLFTNYAEESKAVYDKSGKFTQLDSLKGTRIYIKPCFSRILPLRSKLFSSLKPALKFIDFLLSFINPFPFLARRFKVSDISFEYISFPDDETMKLFEQLTSSSCTARKEEDFKWIFHYPWIVSSPLGDKVGKKYFFSSSPKRFEQNIIKVYRQNALIGFIMLNNIDGFITTPYIHCNSSNAPIFVRIILKHAAIQGAYRITCYHPEIAKELNSMKPFGITSLNVTRNFFASNILNSELSQNRWSFIEGDGDCAFV